MRTRIGFCGLALLSTSLLASPTAAQTVAVESGTTSVLLNFDALASAAGLTLAGVSPEVAAPAALGPNSVGFAINATDGPPLQTTFFYDPNNFLGDFGGAIEHTGTVSFSSAIGTVEVGDFTIGFDGGRQVGLGLDEPTGFFVRTTAGTAATNGVILFDIANPVITPTALDLTIAADLLVSSEFAGFLQAEGLASVDLTGVDVGDALVQAAVPEPASAALVALAAAGALAGRRWRRG